MYSVRTFLPLGLPLQELWMVLRSQQSLQILLDKQHCEPAEDVLVV